MASKVADGFHKLVAGGLITISAAGVGAIGWGVYSLYVLRPAHLKAQAAANATAPTEVIGASNAVTSDASSPASSSAESR